MGSVLVVVIVGVVIVAITASAVRGAPKPATPADPTHRATPPAHLARAATSERVPVAEWAASAESLEEEPPAEGEVVRDERGFLRRLRAFAMLLIVVVVLGAGAAALLGVTILVAARTINGALG